MVRLRNALRLRLGCGLGDAPVYPVTLVVSATAVRSRGTERRRFYQRRLEIGLLDMEKVVAKPAVPAPAPALPALAAHPDERFAIVNVGIGMKFPDVFPRDYAMCEVRVDVSFVAPKDNVVQAAKDMHARIGPYVQQTLVEIAQAAGGTPPFAEAANAAAAQGAEVKSA